MQSIFFTAVVIVLVSGCLDEGHDLYFVAPHFVDKIEVTIDFEHGVAPAKVGGIEGRDTYSITLDDEGKATINDTWPFRWHRTFLVLPEGRLQDLCEFNIIESELQLAYATEGNRSRSTYDGAKYFYTLKRKPPSDNIPSQAKPE